MIRRVLLVLAMFAVASVLVAAPHPNLRKWNDNQLQTVLQKGAGVEIELGVGDNVIYRDNFDVVVRTPNPAFGILVRYKVTNPDGSLSPAPAYTVKSVPLHANGTPIWNKAVPAPLQEGTYSNGNAYLILNTQQDGALWVQSVARPHKGKK